MDAEAGGSVVAESSLEKVVDSQVVHYQPLRAWKYRTTRDFSMDTGLRLPKTLTGAGGYLTLYGADWPERKGILSISAGYAWDGPSGPAIDDATNMRGSLVHDALYQFMRSELLPQSYREEVDALFHKMLLQDGMNSFRAWYYHWGVCKFASFAAEVQDDPAYAERCSP